MRRSLTVLMLLGLVRPAAAQEVGCGVPPGSDRCETWAARYAGPGNGADNGHAIVVSPDGSRVYVAGRSVGAAGSLEATTLAYDAAGARVWEARYPGPATGNDYAEGLALSADGATLYVVATSDGGQGLFADYATIAYDAATGAELWVSRFDYGKGLGDTAAGIALGRGGERVYVTGYAGTSGGSEYDFATVAYDAATGAELWVRSYDGPARFWDVATAIGTGFETGEDGERHDLIYVTGRSNGASTANDHTDYATVAYEEDGAVRWIQRYDGDLHLREYPYSLAVSPDGARVYVTGESMGAGFDYATVAYDARSGEQEWASRWGRGFDDRPLAVATNGARVFVTGFSPNDGTSVNRAAATVAYDAATGTQTWAALHDPPVPVGEAGSSLAVAPDGTRVYVGGLRGGLVFGVGVNALGLAAGYSGFLTLGYAAGTGALAWSGGYGGVAHDDFGQAVAVSPDGKRVYMTGGGTDWPTVAYDA